MMLIIKDMTDNNSTKLYEMNNYIFYFVSIFVILHTNYLPMLFIELKYLKIF